MSQWIQRQLKINYSDWSTDKKNNFKKEKDSVKWSNLCSGALEEEKKNGEKEYLKR